MYGKFFKKHSPLKSASSSNFSRSFPGEILTAKKPQQIRPKKIKILLVDDHLMIREALRKLTDTHDDLMIVGEAGDGEEAIKLAQSIRPDIILMDVNMPVMDGIEATRKITTELSQICVIGLSMNEEGVIEEDMKSAGASAYIQKSEAFESLIKTIRTETSS